MKISIWDLDYYHAKDKVNCFNVNAMKISSFHKQQGDNINFVTRERDIYRPYDVYYIFKDNLETPNPPLDFFTNSKVKWCGKAYSMKAWQIPDAILACRPDYLLYPEHNTRLERAELIRLIGNNNNLLPITQDWRNVFKDKYCIVTDENLWTCSEDVILAALDKIKDISNVSFTAPIWIEKVIKYPSIEEKLFSLQLSTRSQIEWLQVKLNKGYSALEWIIKFKRNFPNCPIKPIEIKYPGSKEREQAVQDFELLKRIIILAKREKILVKIIAPKRTQTPFFFLPELVENWCEMNFKLSWLEFISSRYSVEKNILSGVTDWNKPKKWPIQFVEALRQTYQDKEFLLLRWGNDSVPELEIPWTLWKERFKYEI